MELIGSESLAEPTSSDKVTGWLTIVKGLTPTNAIVVFILVVALVPAYIAWKMINDQTLLDRLMSDYNVLASQNSSCTLRSARQRGEPLTFFISTGFAYEGDDRWTVGVSISHEPNSAEVQSYCEVLNLVVDYMRSPEQLEPPAFPGTDDPLIWKYRDKGGSRDNEKAP